MAKYYVKDRTVFQESQGGRMGFYICECSEYVEGAAERVAAALNFLDTIAEIDISKNNLMNVKAEAEIARGDFPEAVIK